MFFLKLTCILFVVLVRLMFFLQHALKKGVKPVLNDPVFNDILIILGDVQTYPSYNPLAALLEDLPE